MAAFRMACWFPFINPADARLPPAFPSHSDTRAKDSLRHLLRGLREGYIPPRWDQHRPVPAVHSHLPIDALCYTLRPLVAIAKTLPLLHPQLLLIGTRPPPDPPPGRSYRALKTLLKGHLLQDWSLQSPPPLSYPYSPTLVPHSLIGLDRFIAGRIHQMRSRKSYLKAHPNWGILDPDKTCPSCLPEDETFAHAILSCPVKAQQRSRHLPDVVSVGPESDVLTSKDLTIGLVSYIQATGTGLPYLMRYQEWTLY